MFSSKSFDDFLVDSSNLFFVGGGEACLSSDQFRWISILALVESSQDSIDWEVIEKFFSVTSKESQLSDIKVTSLVSSFV